jgi:hypothetical protein
VFCSKHWFPTTVPKLLKDWLIHISSWSSSCGRQSVDQFVWVSGLPLGPMTRFYLVLLSSSDNYFILLSKVPFLTRKRVCSLQCNHSLVRLLTTNNHTLLSHLRLYSLSVASYDSQGLRWRYSNPPPHGEEWELSTISNIGIQFVPHRNHISSPLHIQPGQWGPTTIHYRLIWDCAPFLSPLTTPRDCGGGILTRLHTGLTHICIVTAKN